MRDMSVRVLGIDELMKAARANATWARALWKTRVDDWFQRDDRRFTKLPNGDTLYLWGIKKDLTCACVDARTLSQMEVVKPPVSG